MDGPKKLDSQAVNIVRSPITEESAQKDCISSLPLDVLCHIVDPLHVYDHAKLAITSLFMHKRFFVVALKPECRKEQEQWLEEQKKTSRNFWWDLFSFVPKFLSKEQEYFATFEESRKSKYLICDEIGLNRLKQLGLDSPLMKEKMASGQMTEEQILANKVRVKNEIDQKLNGVLTAQARKNLQSNLIQECLVIEFLTISEAELISDLVMECLKELWPYLEPMVGRSQVTKQDVFNADEDMLAMVSVIEVKFLLESKRLNMAQCLQWNKDSVEIKVFQLNLIRNFLVDITDKPRQYREDMTIQILNKANLLMEIHEKFVDRYTSIRHYLNERWHKKLTIEHCVTADPEVIRALVLKDFDFEIASLVISEMISVEVLLTLTPSKIQMLCNNAVRSALRCGHLTSRDFQNDSADDLLREALKFESERDENRKPKSHENCTLQ